MNGELERFLEEVKTDSKLQERIASMQTAAEVIEEAAQRGFNFSESDIVAASEAGSKESGSLGYCRCYLEGAGCNYDELDKPEYECACLVCGVGVDKKTKQMTCFCVTNGEGKAR